MHTHTHSKIESLNNSTAFKRYISSIKTVSVWPSDPLFIHLSVCPFVMAMAGGQLIWCCGRPPFGVRASVNVTTGFVKFFPTQKNPSDVCPYCENGSMQWPPLVLRQWDTWCILSCLVHHVKMSGVKVEKRSKCVMNRNCV